MAPIRLLLADNHQHCLAVAARLLDSRYEVVTMVTDGESVIDEASRLAPDVLVRDISMPALNGIATARRLRAQGFCKKIIFMSVHGDSDYVRAAVAVGAHGYVIKSQLASDLPLAVNEVMAGRQFISLPLTANEVLESDPAFD